MPKCKKTFIACMQSCLHSQDLPDTHSMQEHALKDGNGPGDKASLHVCVLFND